MKSLLIAMLLLVGQDKLKPPSGPETKRAEKEVHDLFPVEYSRKEKGERLAFSQKLLEAATNPRDDAALRWVLLRDAGAIASEGQDLITALLAATRRAEIFDVKLEVLRETAITTAKKSIKTPEDALDLLDACLKLGFESLRRDDSEAAAKWSKEAEECAKGKGPKAADRARELTAACVEVRKEAKAMTDAELALSVDAENPEANLMVGRHWCFSKGDWGKGIPYLFKGSDAALRGLAAAEDPKPTEPDSQAALADAWADAASKKPADKQIFLERARYWYELAQKGASGILKAKLDRKLADGPAPLGGISLIRYIDVAKPVSGDWKLDGQALLSPKGAPGVAHRVEISFYPGLEYDLSMTVETKEGGHFLVGLVGAGKRQFMIDVYDSVCGLTLLDGKHYDQNETTARGKLISKDAPLTLSFSVRRSGVEVKMNGATTINWKGDFMKFTTEGWKVSSDRSLFIGSSGSFQFTRILFNTVSGDAKPLK